MGCMVCELHLIKLLTNRQEIVYAKILQRQVAEHMEGDGNWKIAGKGSVQGEMEK